jgi:hypothetical protein
VKYWNMGGKNVSRIVYAVKIFMHPESVIARG